MGKKALAVVPVLGKESKLERFHGDATENPLYTVVTWSTQTSASQAARKRQLAIAGKKLLEMQRFQAPENERSWFIGNDVQQGGQLIVLRMRCLDRLWRVTLIMWAIFCVGACKDGSILVFTQIDPLFVLLASTWRHRDRSMALYDLLSQDHNSWLTQVAACTSEKIQVICDVQPTGGGASLDSLFVKANEAKVIKWLCAKVNRVAKTLAKHASEAKAQSNSGNFDANFVLPGQNTEPKPEVTAAASTAAAVDPSTFNRSAIELVTDYLPDELIDLLFKEFKYVNGWLRVALEPNATDPNRTCALFCRIEKLVPVSKQTASPANPHEMLQRFDRRLQVDSSNPNSATKRAPTPATAAAAKKKSKLANVDRTGMKSLTSFFTKK